MAQAPIYYLDNRQENTAAEPVAWTDIVTAQTIYQNNPIPSGVSAEQAARVIGVQGQMWTERARKEDWITRQIFPPPQLPTTRAISVYSTHVDGLRGDVRTALGCQEIDNVENIIGLGITRNGQPCNHSIDLVNWQL